MTAEIGHTAGRTVRLTADGPGVRADGEMLATAGDDGTVRVEIPVLCDLPPGERTHVTVTAVDVDDPAQQTTLTGSLLVAEPGSGVVADYEISNEGTETLTYSVVFTFMSGDGGAVTNQTATVRDVGPGKTVRGTVRAGELPPAAPRVTQAKVLTVTRVPASEAPTAPGTCPASGIRVSADEGDAAMGLRVVGLRLDNCGTRAYTVEGYPLLELLDNDLKRVDGVEILDGSGEITTGAGPDKRPRPVTLSPGESATAGLVWRNTTEFGTPVTVLYVRVRAKTGADPVTVTPNLDLGTTGKLGVRPWEKAER
ncbi:DUF4232 domain-containing protein [Streptomyces sp. ADMS]|uniref:DUF4232 domain-containing protein n=1 Tax=Streptomyces sp. ADMS TaxID=3071415 RepID=UPI00296E965C|nr:DUF4232 domain-containing protein [Streptomyces sp. ADMS]MDW4908991.1 DUF4232 domain-containing protein [Streptomyces sp. ADMS]